MYTNGHLKICIFKNPNQYHLVEILFSFKKKKKKKLLKVMTLPPEDQDCSPTQNCYCHHI